MFSVINFSRSSHILIKKREKKFIRYGTQSKSNEDQGCVRPFKEIPTFSKFTMIKHFLPGGKFYKKNLTDFVKILQKDHGDIFYFQGIFGKKSLIFTHNPDDFAKIFRTEGLSPIRYGVALINYHRSEYRKDYFQGVEGITSTQGEKWRTFRTVVNPVLLKPENINIYIPKVSKVASEFVERIKTIRDPVTLEVSDNFIEEISHWALKSISVVALDKEIDLFKEDQTNNTDAKELFTNLVNFLRLSYELDIKVSMWKIFPTPKFRQVMTSLDVINGIIIKYVNDAIERLQNVEKQSKGNTSAVKQESILEKLLKIDKKIATVMAMDMLMTGVDTTTSVLTGILLCLAKNPDKQEILRQEIFKLLIEKQTPLLENSLNNIPYLRACIKEGLRLYPLAVGTMRNTQKDLVLSGYHVPKGIDVTMLMISILKDPKYFSKPNDFIPERWLPSNAPVSDGCPFERNKIHPFVNLPFGFGPRSCIGRRIAYMELETIIARLIRNFKIEFHHSTENAFDSYVINVPAIPLKFKFIDVIDD